MHTTTVVIGAGRVGRTVAARLSGARLYGRGQQPDLDGCRRVLIATPDAEIERVCGALAPGLDPEASVILFSGALAHFSRPWLEALFTLLARQRLDPAGLGRQA